jgi:NodT family efflux transporter outer membrane factor (OMF) lipoprotein
MRMIALLVAAGAALLALAGCTTVGPDFDPVPVHAPDRWQDWHGGDAALAAAEAGAPAALASWDGLLDPVLHKLVLLADEANGDVQTAALRFAQARMQRTISQAQAGPQASGRAAATRQRLSESGASTRLIEVLPGGNRQALVDFLSSPYSLYEAGFDASWELDLWGRVKRSIEAAQASADQAEALLRQVRLAVRAELAHNYTGLRGAQRQLRLTRQQFATAQERADLVAARVAGGLVPELESVRQRGVLADLQSRIPPLAREEAAFINQITILVGKRPGSMNQELAARGDDRGPGGAPELALGLPSELAARRPDIAAAMARLHAATAGIGVAVGDLYPRITLNGSFGFESLSAGQFGDWGSRQWRFGPALSIPLFDQGRRRGVVQLRELEQQEAAIAFQQTVLKAWHEVDSAITDYNAERQREVDLLAGLDSARAAMQLVQERYRNGLSDFDPVLEARRALLQAESAYSDHQTRLATAWITLLKALGAGIEPAGRA